MILLLLIASLAAAEPATLEEAEAAYKAVLAEHDALVKENTVPLTRAMVAELKPEEYSLERIYGCEGEKRPFVAVVAGYEWSFLAAAPFLRQFGLKPVHKYYQTKQLSRRIFNEQSGRANVETYSWVDDDEIVADVLKALASGRCRPIILMGFSYGGDTVSQLLNEFKKKGVYVDLSIELDTIGRSDQKVPDNVHRAVCVYQEKGPLNGNDHLEGGLCEPVHLNLGPIGHAAIAQAPERLVSLLKKEFKQLSYPGVNRMTPRDAFNRYK